MGFGWLLCGYFATFMMRWHDYGFIAVMIGCFIMWNATLRLKDYCPAFLLTGACSIALIVLSCYDVLDLLSTTFPIRIPFVTETVTAVVDGADFVLEMALQFCLLYAVMRLSREVGVAKIYGKIGLYMSLFAVCTALQIAMWIAPTLVNIADGFLFKTLLLFLLMSYLMVSFLLFRCYQYICPEGEENGKERKPSRFGFVNRLRAKADERDDQMYRDAQDMMKRKIEKRQDKQRRRKK